MSGKDNQEKPKVYHRSSKEQLKLYLRFVQENPGFLKNKDPNRTKELWNILAKKLNEIRGPTRTAAKWKQTLNHWKHQLHSRVRKVKTHKRLTGGGPARLSNSEAKALEVFKYASVRKCELPPENEYKINIREESTSLESLSSVSTSAPDQVVIKIEENTDTEMEPDPCPIKLEGVEESEILSDPYPIQFGETIDNEIVSDTCSTSVSTSDMYAKVKELCEKIAEMDKSAEEDRRRFQQQILKSQEMMAAALRTVGEGLLAIGQLTNAILQKSQST